jgi:hypothetical protein
VFSATPPEKIWSPRELNAVIARAETIMGESLDRLVRKAARGRASHTPPTFRHRFIEQLALLRNAANDSTNGLAQGAASVVITDVDGMLHALEAWQADPVWPEFHAAIKDPRNFLHATTTLMVASAMKEHHQGVALVASSKSGRAADLAITVTNEHGLAVEVKTSQLLGQRELSQSESLKLVEGAASKAGTTAVGQLPPGTPAMLVIGGPVIDQHTFRRLQEASVYVLEHATSKQHVLGIVIARIFFDVRIVNQRVQVVLCQETRITRNPKYKGRLKLVGDWAEDWHLVPVSS